MARKKAAHEAAQKKAAKQKKVLMVLALPMLGALVFAVMTFMNLGKHPGDVAATPASATTPAGSVPAAGTPTDGTAAAPVTPGVAVVPVDAFRSFAALGRKNPFHDHGPNLNAGSDSGGNGSNSSNNNNADSKNKNGKGSGGNGGGGSTSKQPAAPLTGAVISLNGDKLAVSLGSTFGKAPGLSGVPLFRLVKATAKSALIGVVGTKQQFTLHVNRPLTLQQYGGWTYTLILEPLGSAAPMTVQQTTTTTGP
jgi:hypothetical protein